MAGLGILARARLMFALLIAAILALGTVCLIASLRTEFGERQELADANAGIERVQRITQLIEKFRLVYAGANAENVTAHLRAGAPATLLSITRAIREDLYASGTRQTDRDPLMADALRPMLDSMDSVIPHASAAAEGSAAEGSADRAEDAVSDLDALTARALELISFECARQYSDRDKAASAQARADTAVWATLVCTVLSIVACVLMLANATRDMRRVGRIAQALTRLAEGDTAAPLPVPDRTDEVGAMAASAAAFHRTLIELTGRRSDLRETNERFATALDGLHLAVTLYDRSHRLLLSNSSFQAWFSAGYALLPPGTHVSDVTRHLTRLSGMHPDRTEREVTANQAALDSVGMLQAERQLADGRLVTMQAAATPDGGLLVTYEDITERRRTEQQAAYLEQHDPLTGLANRTLFRERLGTALGTVRQGGRQTGLAVLCMDVDHFADVNEQLGPDAGDELLVAVACRLYPVLRDGDTLARLGADEFAIIQCHAERPEHATTLAARVIAAMAAPFDLGGRRVGVGITIGIAMAPSDGDTPEQLLRASDLALVRAKVSRRGAWQFFEPAMDAAAQARRALEADLREAVVTEAFELYFQPLVSMAAHRISGFEALLRWRHPQRGMVSPAEFIPVCEEIGLIVPLGEWVLRRACTEAMSWPAHVKVAVNLSPAQFRGRSVVDVVAAVLEDTGLPAHRLELEITESVLLTDSAETLGALHRLRALGVRISMDDFGTGYSSLSYLRSFPFDKIKIDRSFIMEMDEREDSVAIVRAVAGLGASLGIVTTAEGVETRAQLAQVFAEGCDEVQGYFFSPPRPADEVLAIIRRVDATAPTTLAA